MTGILLFLKGVPLWVWAVLVLVGAGLFYGHLRYQAGQADIQQAWDAQRAKDQAEVDRQNRENRAKEAADKAAAEVSRGTYEKAIADGKQRASALAADLVSERRKLRNIWTGGRCHPSPDSPADRSGESDAKLRAEALERVSGIGSEADARVTFLLSRYAQAEKVCGTIPTE